MAIKQNVESLFKLKRWRLSQEQDLPFRLVPQPIEAAGDWLIPCQHRRRPPISNHKLDQIAHVLPIEIPHQLQELLKVTNGAELFCIEQADGWGETNLLSRIELLNGFEVLCHHVGHLESYLFSIKGTSEIDTLPWKLNYIAFADVFDGNFLAINIEDGSVFFLDHDFSYFPFGQESLDSETGYIRIANSLDEWIQLVVSS